MGPIIGEGTDMKIRWGAKDPTPLKYQTLLERRPVLKSGGKKLYDFDATHALFMCIIPFSFHNNCPRW